MRAKYFLDVDIFKVYFVPPQNNNVVDNSDEISPGIVVDYDEQDKLLAIDIASASKVLLK